MNLEQLRALRSVIDEESFEGAAYELGVSPSAISQRIKALEGSVGQVLVRRGTPCTPTSAGEVLLTMARQVEWLEAEALASLTGAQHPAQRVATPLAVNADSLATWFREVFPIAAEWNDLTLELTIADESVSTELLRRGEVLGAVTSTPTPVHGCTVTGLGLMRFLPVASPAFLERHPLTDGRGWAEAPVLRFNADDAIQLRFLARRGVDFPTPTHQVPSSEGFFDAVTRGLGWGLVPEPQLRAAQGHEFVVLNDDFEDVPLYWQRWSLRSERLDRITEALVATAAAHLRPLDDPSEASRDRG